MKLKRLFLFVMAVSACSCERETTISDAVPTGSEDVESYNRASVVPGWIRIKLSDNAAPLMAGEFTRGGSGSGNAELDEVAARLGATEIKRVFRDGGRFAERRRRHGLHLWYDLRIDAALPVSRAAEEIANVKGVEIVEPVYKTSIADHRVAPDFSNRLYTPVPFRQTAEKAPFDDPELGKQWNYNNDGSLEESVAGADINLFKAWSLIGTGDPAVIVAVIDGGIQCDHPDLVDNMWINEAELNGVTGADDDRNGYIDDIHGWNYFTDTGEITPHYHGTHVAGTVAAVNNNGVGVCGVAGGSGAGDGVRLMSCQSYVTLPNGESDGTVNPDSFAYAADRGAVIAQNSWGYTGTAMPASMRSAILYFIREAGTDENGLQTGPMKGGIVCFSAGNSGAPQVNEPANMEEVIAVTSMDPNYDKASYSNYGVAADIMAPGGAYSGDPTNPRQLYSTYTDSGYAYLWGTSMACPHVSGVAALIVSHYGAGTPGFTAERCREILLRSYRPVGEYLDEEYAEGIGVGLMDASLILLEDPAVAPEAVSDLELVPFPDNMKLSATIPADGNGDAVLAIYVEYVSVKDGRLSGPTVTKTFRNTKPAGSRFETVLTLVAEKTYRVGIYTEDRYGNRSETVYGTETTLPHINLPPEYNNSIGTQVFAAPGPASRVAIELGEYFTDPDIPYGDVLQYRFEVSREGIMDISLHGSELVMIPKFKGTVGVTVTASDRFGESVSGSFDARVMSGEEVPSDPSVPDPPFVYPAEGKITVSPNPADDLLSIWMADVSESPVRAVVYDAAARRMIDTSVMIDSGGCGTLDVEILSPGAYSLLIVAEGRSEKASFMKNKGRGRKDLEKRNGKR